LPSNIRLGRKDLPGQNPPDFSSVMPVTMMKGFYKITGWNPNSSETAKKDFVCTN
jgi:hypothetical protein